MNAVLQKEQAWLLEVPWWTAAQGHPCLASQLTPIGTTSCDFEKFLCMDGTGERGGVVFICLRLFAVAVLLWSEKALLTDRSTLSFVACVKLFSG